MSNQMLRKRPASPNDSYEELIARFKERDAKAADSLIQGGALDVDAIDRERSRARRETLLGVALGTGDTELLDVLLLRSKRLKSMGPAEASGALLSEAARLGATAAPMLMKTFRLGQRPDQPDGSGRTPMGWAISRGDDRTFQFLSERGADPSQPADGGDSGVDMIASGSHPNSHGLAALLAMPLAKVRERRASEREARESALLDALARCDFDRARESLRTGSFVRWGDGSQSPAAEEALSRALKLGRSEAVRLLFLETPMTRDELMLAAIEADSPLPEAYEWGAGPGGAQAERPDRGAAMLIHACRRGNARAVAALLRAGSDPLALDVDGRCAADVAEGLDNSAIEDLLYAHATSEQDLGALDALFEGLDDEEDFPVFIADAEHRARPAGVPSPSLAPQASPLVFPPASAKAFKARSVGDPDGKRVSARACELMARNGGRRVARGAPEARSFCALRESFPTFSEVIDDLSSRAAIARRAQAKAGTPRGFKIPNILLVGAPGMGKTHFARAVAAACRLDFHEVQMGAATGFALAGVNAGYSTARPGRVFEALAEGDLANPLFLLDEIDKASGGRDQHSVMGPLFSLLERGSSASWQDLFVEEPMDASHVNFMASANSVEGMDSAILSRFTVYEIPEPDEEQSRKIARSVYREVLAREGWADLFDPELREESLERLAGMTPRDAHAALSRALPLASLRGRDHALPADFKPAKLQARRIGF